MSERVAKSDDDYRFRDDLIFFLNNILSRTVLEVIDSAQLKARESPEL
jgi:hypothetical protein